MQAAKVKHRSQSILTNRTNSTWRYDVFGEPRQSRGAMVFSGPDSLRMHRQKRLDSEYIGSCQFSPERSASALFVLNAAPGTPHPRPKSAFSGAIGWGCWSPMTRVFASLDSGHQIKLDTFRQAVEQQFTHVYQNARSRYPGSDDIIDSNSDRKPTRPKSTIEKYRQIKTKEEEEASPTSQRYRASSGRLLTRETVRRRSLGSTGTAEDESTDVNS